MADVTFEDKTDDPGIPADDPTRKLTAANVNEIKTAVNSKSDQNHSHSITDVDGLTEALSNKQDAISPLEGWDDVLGTEARGEFDSNRFTSVEDLKILAQHVGALIKDLKAQGILV